MSKRHIFSHLLILTTLILIFSAFSHSPAKAQEKYYFPEEIQARVRNLESLNLLKGLHLNAGQMKKLLVLLYEARLAEKEVLEGFRKDSLHTVKMMNMLTEKLKKGEGIGVKTEEAVWFSLGTLYEYEYDQYRTTEKLVYDARKILNKNQLRIISEYMPCIIPWSTVKAPERIGQSGSIAKLEKILDKLRTLKGDEYKKEKRLFLIELDWRLRIDRHEDDKTRQILVRKIDEKIDKICKLPENEYQIRKEDLAQSIRPPDLDILPPRVGEELNEYIAEYILNPANIEYLQYQLEARGVKDYPKLKDVLDKDIDSEVKENNNYDDEKDEDID